MLWPRPRFGLVNQIGQPQPAPVTTIDRDGCKDILHHSKLAIAHVTAVGLQKERALALACGQSDTIIKDAAISAMFRIPSRVT